MFLWWSCDCKEKLKAICSHSFGSNGSKGTIFLTALICFVSLFELTESKSKCNKGSVYYSTVRFWEKAPKQNQNTNKLERSHTTGEVAVEVSAAVVSPENQTLSASHVSHLQYCAKVMQTKIAKFYLFFFQSLSNFFCKKLVGRFPPAFCIILSEQRAFLTGIFVSKWKFEMYCTV